MKLFQQPKLTGKYLSGVLSSRWLTTGPTCKSLQKATADFLGVAPERVVLASSATSGFQGVMDLLTYKLEKDVLRVRITDATWPGMKQAIAHANSLIRREAADVTVLTDVGGRRFIDEDTRHDGVLVHDACHSWMPDLGADFGIVSFYPTKLVPGAEGGAVVCKSADDAEEMRLWIYCGTVPGQASAPKVPGRKANLTDVTAALNLEALELAPRYMEGVAEAWARLADEAERAGLAVRQQEHPYLFQLEVGRSDIPEVMRALAGHGVPAAWNFRPAQLVTLPCYPGMTDVEVTKVIEAAKVVLA